MFRYRLVVYHENQPWIPEVSRLLDLPFFHVFSTDSGILLQQQLEGNEVDLVITNFQSRVLALLADPDNSMAFQESSIWKTIQNQNLHHKVVLMCSLQDVEIAADLVQQGMASDYVIVDPMLDSNRPVLTLMKVLESNSLRDLVSTHLMQNTRLPLHPVESLEILKTTLFEPASPGQYPVDPEPVSQRKSVGIDHDYKNALGGNFLAQLDDDEDSLGLDGLMFQLHGNAASESGKLLARSVPMDVDFENKSGGGKILAPNQLNEIPIDLDFPLTDGSENIKDVTRRGAWTNLQKSDEPILLIEGPGSSIGQIITTLKRANLKARVVNSAQDALAALNRELFELILINMELPDQKGLQFVRRIRLKGPQADINVIMLSDRARHEDVIKSVQVGANYFIIKPFDPDRFLKHIAQHIPIPKA